MRNCLITAIAVCMVAAIASSASAGYFIGDGWVAPSQGYADYTIFTYYVLYQLENQEEPPNVQHGLWDGESGIWAWTDMQVTRLPDEVCCYWRSTWLYYSSEGWWFRFQTWGPPFQETNTQSGPTVWE